MSVFKFSGFVLQTIPETQKFFGANSLQCALIFDEILFILLPGLSKFPETATWKTRAFVTMV
jgi:hypothetical protein